MVARVPIGMCRKTGPALMVVILQLMAHDLKKQVLIGEYGAWRTIDLHTEGGFVQNGILSEDRMTQLMEQKDQVWLKV